MFHHIMDAIIREQNLGLVRRDIAHHWACRCTVPGPGMHQAAELLVRRYRENGAEAENIAYAATADARFLGGHATGLEWRPQDASLAIVSPATPAGTLCRYQDEPISLVCYSAATPPAGIEAEVVVRNGALSVADVQEGEMAGKLLFTDQPPGSVEMAAERAGAVGIVSDCVCPPWLASHPPVREPEDAPDLVMWTVFSPTRTDRTVFGFNLSGRQGRRLRKLIAEAAEPVRLRAFVSAETCEGVSDLVNAWLPGTDLAHEEVWVLGHLSEPGARDNASGCCLSLELARVLRKLTSDGTLPPLRRTVRFLHATEVNGFLPYIEAQQDRLPQVVAGLCLDSVGADLTICGGEVVLDQSPETNASFVDGLMETLLRAAAAEPVERFSTENYAIFPWHTEPFWGNDAFVSDGFFDIPTPHAMTWPDRFYHSSQDTPDQMSDNTLGRFGAMDGTFLYLLATAGPLEAKWLAHLAAQDWRKRLADAAADQVTQRLGKIATVPVSPGIASRLRHLAMQGADAITQAVRFAPDDQALASELATMAAELREFAEAAFRRASLALREAPDQWPAPQPPTGAGCDQVWRRRQWTAPAAGALSEAGQERLAALEAEGGGPARAWAWINGRRSVSEVWERLQHGGAVPCETVAAYLALMAEEGVLASGG